MLVWKLQCFPFAYTVYLRPSVKTNVLSKIIYENAYNFILKTNKIVLSYFYKTGTLPFVDSMFRVCLTLNEIRKKYTNTWSVRLVMSNRQDR